MSDQDLEAIQRSLAGVTDPLALLAGFFAHSPVAFQVFDASGRSRLVNRAFVELFGAAPPPEYDVLNDELAARDGYLELIRRAFAGETIRVPPVWYDATDLRQVDVQGNRVCISATLFPLRAASGEVTHVALAFRDLTAETLAREQAEADRAILDSLVDQASIAMRFLDRDLRYVRMNAAAARLTGLPIEAHLGKTVLEALPGIDPAAHETSKRALETGTAITHEIPGEMPGAPGVPRWWRVHHYPVRLRGETIGVGALIEDVTAAREVERERARSMEREALARAEAETANRLKDELLATVSHELRTPLSAIVGWSRLLESGTLTEVQQKKAIATIDRNARLQVQLIEDLLDIARMQSGTLRLELAPVDLGGLLEAALEAARPSAAQKDVSLSLEIAAGAGHARADAVRMQQIVGTLLANAIKFTARGGSVRVALREEADAVVLAVRDDGQGIAPELLPYVFDRFRQGSGGSHPSSGLGIGLSVTKILVEMHGGAITAHSEGRGKGAELVVRLPTCRTTPGAVATTASERPRQTDSERSRSPTSRPLEGTRVLVVDDDADARELVAHVLSFRGAEVRVAASVPMALDVLASFAPAVLVSDVAMPGASGHDLVRTLRARPHCEGGDLPAIALSAFARPEDSQASLRAGFDRHLTKPIDADALVRAIAELAIRTG
ncbi:MAG: PAS domain-containing protein [Myxococcota bacterium]|nr:PAS domain-containing protein [Myxococcota bacterium]